MQHDVQDCDDFLEEENPLCEYQFNSKESLLILTNYPNYLS